MFRTCYCDAPDHFNFLSVASTARPCAMIAMARSEIIVTVSEVCICMLAIQATGRATVFGRRKTGEREADECVETDLFILRNT